MPANPTLSTNNTVDTGTPAPDANTAHGILNAIYKATIGTTITGAVTLNQAVSGEIKPVSVTSSVAITVPSLEAGTTVELVQTNTAGFTLTASGVTLLVPTGATATPRGQYSVVSLTWLTTTTVLVGGDLT